MLVSRFLKGALRKMTALLNMTTLLNMILMKPLFFKRCRVLPALFTLLIWQTCAAIGSEASLRSISEIMLVKYQVISNIQDDDCEQIFAGPCFAAQMNFHLPYKQTSKPFDLYFSHIAPIKWDDHPDLDIEHINGDLHVIRFPANIFVQNNSLSINMKAAFWHASHSDIMPNQFVVSDSEGPYIVDSTRAIVDELTGLQQAAHLKPHSEPEQIKRNSEDKLAFAGGQWLFDYYHSMLPKEQMNSATMRIIPNFYSTDWSSDRAFDRRTFDQGAVDQKALGQNTLGQNTLDLGAGVNIQSKDFTMSPVLPTLLKEAGINLSISGVAINVERQKDVPEQGYKMQIQQQGITIVAADNAGINNAFVSLYQMLKTEGLSLPIGNVEDQPRFAYRGVHVDLSRNYLGKDVIMHLIEQMHYLKLNKLHLHLADDEGWRLELPAIPELTQVGGFRCFDVNEDNCLLPQLGSGPFRDSPTNGFLTTEEYQDILVYAHQRHIEVIPSFDLPGHARAAVKAMEARYRKYKNLEQNDKAEEFLLSDFADDTVYSSVQFYNDNTVNPCLESTYHFIDTIIGAVSALHKQVNVPLNTYHIGADETAGAWTHSPVCKKRIAQENALNTVSDLKPWFLSRVIEIVEKHELQAAGWSDGMHKVLEAEAGQGHQVNIWDPLFWNGHEKAREFSDKGWTTVLSIPDVNYFDFPYANHPAEPGYYWASKNTDEYKVFQFMPQNLEANAVQWLDRMGNPYYVQSEHEQSMKLAGMQTQIWTESVRNVETFQYLMYPRLQVFAERAWYKAPWEMPQQKNVKYSYSSVEKRFFTEQQKDWQDFEKAMLRYLDGGLLNGANLRVPPPGIKFDNGMLHVNAAWKRLIVQCRDNESTWQVIAETSKDYTQSQSVTCRSWLKKANKYSREVTITH